MISAWTKHLKDPDDISRFQNSLYGSKFILQRLQELLKEEEDNLDTMELSAKMFDLPNWDHRQAYNNGFRKALKTINKIINLDQKENK